MEKLIGDYIKQLRIKEKEIDDRNDNASNDKFDKFEAGYSHCLKDVRTQLNKLLLLQKHKNKNATR